jgi:ketosteroid isomerase-like protein
MSQENVEVVRRCYGLGADRDFSALSELAHPDVVVDLSRNVFNPGAHRGLEGFRHFVEQVDEMWEDFQIEPEEFVDAGDNVFVASRMSGRGRGSGVEVEMRAFAVWTLREGKVSRFRRLPGSRRGPRSCRAVGVGESQENVEGGAKVVEVYLTATQDRWACSQLRCDLPRLRYRRGRKQKE